GEERRATGQAVSTRTLFPRRLFGKAGEGVEPSVRRSGRPTATFEPYTVPVTHPDCSRLPPAVKCSAVGLGPVHPPALAAPPPTPGQQANFSIVGPLAPRLPEHLQELPDRLHLLQHPVARQPDTQLLLRLQRPAHPVERIDTEILAEPGLR